MAEEKLPAQISLRLFATSRSEMRIGMKNIVNEIKGEIFDEERALYNLKQTSVIRCRFAGPADGESVLKEAKDVKVSECDFSLRYPMWHVDGYELSNSVMDELTRAALWYTTDGRIQNCRINGIKAVRECKDIEIDKCEIDSCEFGWKSNNIIMTNTKINSEYIFLDSNNVILKNVNMTGKYSFQYMNNLEIANSVLDTKDAFWHSKNVTVKNSIVKGEYLAWFSENLTLIDCEIIGTQPLCYCKNLKLINCTMKDTDLSFEYSDVNAEIIGNIDSVKNPKSGTIIADSVGDIIFGDAVIECSGEVLLRNNKKKYSVKCI